ncbi:MAG: acetyl esterase [Halieaceae bacterium]|jgi:acetyl esterase
MLQSLKVGFFRRFYRCSAWLAWRAPSVHSEPGGLELPSAIGQLRAHLYEGPKAAERPLVIYFHGGGWVVGDLQTHHAYCRALSQHSGATLIAIDYRLAPEHLFPAAHDDCLAAADSIAERIGDFGPSNGSIVLAGDSAGANLAVCTALDAGDTLRAKLSGTLLTYPVADHYSTPYPSYQDCATGQALTSKMMLWFWDSYLGNTDPQADSARRAMPLQRDDLQGLPPALICTAGRDPLRDEGMAFVKALEEVGVAVAYEHYPDSEHGFASTMGPSEDYTTWLDCCSSWLGALTPPQS